MLDEKRKQKVEFEPGISCSPDWHPRKHGYRGFTFLNVISNTIIQFLSNSKVAKTELYLIGGYHNEWLELTYCIETLILCSESLLSGSSTFDPGQQFCRYLAHRDLKYMFRNIIVRQIDMQKLKGILGVFGSFRPLQKP